MSAACLSIWPLLAIFCHTVAHGQVFNERYDHAGLSWPELGWSIERADSSYLIFESFGETPSSDARVGFVCRGADGAYTVLSEFFADSTNYTCGWANTTDAIPGGGYVACGTTDAEGTARALVWRFSGVGDSLWSKKLYDDSGYVSLGYMAKGLSDGSIVAVGTLLPPNESADIFLAKLSSDGQLLWTQTYGSSEIDKGYSVDLMPDGGFVIGGYSTAFGNGGHETYVLRTDSAGNQLWHRWFGGAEDDCIGNVTVADNGDVLIAGCEVMDVQGNLPYFRSQLIRLTSDGSTIWNNLYGPTDVIDGRWCVKELGDGSLIAPGTIAGASGYPQGSLLKVAANGDSLWMRSYSHPGVLGWLDWHELRDIVIEPDGGVTACGFLVDTANQDLWVIRVDSFGCLVPGCQQFDNLEEQGLEMNVLVYPNPTRDRIFLSFRSAAPPDGEFALLNVAGQVVRRFAPGGQNVEIDLDVSDLPTGLYLLRYTDPTGSRWESKVIKE